jgi:hypothetical protein
VISTCSVFLLALFLEIYQQSWKDENENGKIIDILQNLQKLYESLNITVFEPSNFEEEKNSFCDDKIVICLI